jgi:hypothetical protein
MVLMFGSVLRTLILTALTVTKVVLLLVVELVSTMLVYIYLNLNHLPLFGYLARLARDVLDAFVSQLEFWLPGSANTAYATLLGELGPKSILLLLIGLLVATVIRFGVQAVSNLIWRLLVGEPVPYRDRA